MSDLISVIVPVYNTINYLSDCVDSILFQTYPNLELILIDDGSTDGSGNMCDDMSLKDDRIIVIHKENGGVSAARNLGLDNASGEWITFVDADDIVDKHYIDYMLKAAKDTGNSIVGCVIDRFIEKEKIAEAVNIDDNFIDELIDTWDLKESIHRSIEVGKYSANVSNKLIRRSIIEDNESLRFDTDVYYGEDMLFFYKVLLRAGAFTGVNIPMYHYRENESSAIGVVWNLKWDSVLEAYDRQHNLLLDYDTGYFPPHIAHQEACISLFIRRYTTGNPMDSHMKKRILPVVRDRFFYLLFSKEIHVSIKLAGIIICISPNLAERLYKLFLNIRR